MRVLKSENINYLHLIPFANFSLWDTKRYTSQQLSSSFPIVKLGDCIIEQNKKYKIFEEEDKEFGILGVNNKEGIFDAYKQKGKEINQPYKKMETGWLAYNPYRINVGSIGIRIKEHKHEYISPAYVVFSCKNNLLPEFLFYLFKTDTFNKVINESTTGSVRQNLTFETLKNLEIPLPSIDEQNKIVALYQEKIQLAEQQAKQANELEAEIERYLIEELGVEKDEELKIKNSFIKIINYKNFERWDGKTNAIFNSNYKILKIGDCILNISTGTTPSTSRHDYFNGDVNFYTPADLTNEMYLNKSERTVTQLAINDRKARKFVRGTLLFVGIGSTIGKVGIVNNEFATCNQQITGLQLNPELLDLEYTYYYFDIFKKITKKEKTQATIPIVNQDKILNIPIPVPTIEKQKEISTYINNLKNKIELLIQKSEQNKIEAIKKFENVIFS